MFFRNENYALELMDKMGFVVPLDMEDIHKSNNESVLFTIHGLIRLDPFHLAKFVTEWSMDNYLNILFMTEHGIFPSSENLHMYYTTRRSYGNLSKCSRCTRA
jgi:hypothetical protein